MAVYKSVKGVGKTKSSLYNILKYVGSQNEKEKDDRVYKTTGINVSDDYKKAFLAFGLTFIKKPWAQDRAPVNQMSRF